MWNFPGHAFINTVKALIISSLDNYNMLKCNTFAFYLAYLLKLYFITYKIKSLVVSILINWLKKQHQTTRTCVCVN